MTDQTEPTCPLGEDCDLTVAWLAGAESKREEMQARIAALEAENRRLRGALEWVRRHGGYAHRDNICAVAVEALLPPAAIKGEGE